MGAAQSTKSMHPDEPIGMTLLGIRALTLETLNKGQKSGEDGKDVAIEALRSVARFVYSNVGSHGTMIDVMKHLAEEATTLEMMDVTVEENIHHDME